MKKIFLIALFLYVASLKASAESFVVKSPNRNIVAELNADKTLSLKFKKTTY